MIRWAVVGTGAAGRVHRAALDRLDGMEVVAVVDRDSPEVADRLRFPNLASALAETSPAAVIVATPNDTHGALIEESLRSKVPVLCEKPVGTTTEVAEAAANLSKSLDVPLGTVLNQRFCAQNVWVRDLIHGGKFTLTHATFDLVLPQLRGWHGDPARSGGLLRLVGIHYIDLMRWWLGEPIGLAVEITDTPEESIASVNLEFPRGQTAQFSLSSGAMKRPGPHHWYLEGTEGKIEIIGDRIVENSGFENEPVPQPTYDDQFFGPGHMGLLAACRETLENGSGFPVPIGTALPSLRLIDKIYSAAKH